MYKEEIIKKCLVDNYTYLFDEKNIDIDDIDDIEILHQTPFHDQILSISLYNKRKKTILNMYVSRKNLDEIISDIRNKKINKLLYE